MASPGLVQALLVPPAMSPRPHRPPPRRLLVGPLVAAALAACGESPGADSDASSPGADAAESRADAATSPDGPTGPTGPGWVRLIGGADREVATAMAPLGGGAVALLGTFNRALDLGPTPVTAPHDGNAFIAGFAADGAVRWVRTLRATDDPSTTIGPDSPLYPGPPRIDATHLVSDAAGNAFVVGRFLGLLDAGVGAPLRSGERADLTGAGSSLFVVKLGPTGAPLWAMSPSRVGGDNGEVVAAAVADDGALVLAGTAFGGVRFGAVDVAGPGFVVRLGADGAHLMSRALPTPLHAAAVTTGPGGAIYLVGADGLTLDGHVAAGLYALALDGGGATRWLVGFGGTAAPSAAVLARPGQPGAHLIVAGEHFGGVDLGAGPWPTATFGDAFVLALAPADGAPRWHRTLGDGDTQLVTAATLDGPDRVLVTASFLGQLDFGTGPLRNPERNAHVAVAALEVATGAALWAHAVGLGGETAARAVVADQHLWLAGYTYGSIDLGAGAAAATGSADAFIGQAGWAWR